MLTLMLVLTSTLTLTLTLALDGPSPHVFGGITIEAAHTRVYLVFITRLDGTPTLRESLRTTY